MFLIVNHVLYYHDKESCLKAYNEYLERNESFGTDDDYIDYMKIVDDEGELIDECKGFK